MHTAAKMHFDEVFQYIGEVGLYQALLYVLLGMPSYFSGYMSISMSFLGFTPEHWCQVDGLQQYPYDQQQYVGEFGKSQLLSTILDKSQCIVVFGSMRPKAMCSISHERL